MVIEEPRIIDEGEELCLRARVRFDTPGLDVPDTVWFRFPAAYRPWINDRSDAVVVGMLPAAFGLGEGIVVEGEVSRRLAHGIREYMTAYHQWWPRRYPMVDVSYAGVTSGGGERAARAVGGTFSGGVDSFYSVWQHMPARETVPGMALTHCLMVNGFNFDVDLDREGEFQPLLDTYRPMLQRFGIEVVTVRHNAQIFQEAVEKARSKMPTMETNVIAAVLSLGNLFSFFYLPGGATYRYQDNAPHGWHPAVLPLLGSDDTEMLFDGGDATRAEKTLVLARWEETYETLRVCWRPTVFNADSGLIENCCRCPKCLRTMATLEMAGALSKYRTFPEPLDRKRMRAMNHVGLDEKLFYYDMLQTARAVGRSDLVRDLRYARFRSWAGAAIRVRILRRPK
jgi:hypothetical protein